MDHFIAFHVRKVPPSKCIFGEFTTPYWIMFLLKTKFSIAPSNSPFFLARNTCRYPLLYRFSQNFSTKRGLFRRFSPACILEENARSEYSLNEERLSTISSSNSCFSDFLISYRVSLLSLSYKDSGSCSSSVMYVAQLV